MAHRVAPLASRVTDPPSCLVCVCLLRARSGPEIFGEGPVCRNCHVYVDNAHVAVLPPKGDDEVALTKWIKNKNAKSVDGTHTERERATECERSARRRGRDRRPAYHSERRDGPTQHDACTRLPPSAAAGRCVESRGVANSPHPLPLLVFLLCPAALDSRARSSSTRP